MRDQLKNIGLGDMVEEIFPFTAEHSHNLVTILSDEDVKGTKFWSDETLLDAYHKSQGKVTKTS